MSERTVAEFRTTLGARIAAAEAAGPPALLFVTTDGGRVRTRRLKQIVQEAAARVFPRPHQVEIRRKVRPGGFRDVFIARLLRRPVWRDWI